MDNIRPHEIKIELKEEEKSKEKKKEKIKSYKLKNLEIKRKYQEAIEKTIKELKTEKQPEYVTRQI